MPLFETFALTITAALAKHMLSEWLGSRWQTQVGQDFLDLLRDRVIDKTVSKGEIKQVDDIAAKTVGKMDMWVKSELRDLSDADRRASLIEVTRTLLKSSIDAKLLVANRLDSDLLAQTLLNRSMDSTFLLSASAGVLYERVLRESVREIVSHASSFAGYSVSVDAKQLADHSDIIRLLTSKPSGLSTRSHQQQWQDLLELCQKQVAAEIRATVGNKYIGELYVPRDIENKFTEFANKATLGKPSIVKQLNNVVTDLQRERGRLRRNSERIQEEIATNESDKRFVQEFVERFVEQGIPAEIARDWQSVKRAIDLLDTTSDLLPTLIRQAKEIDERQQEIEHGSQRSRYLDEGKARSERAAINKLSSDVKQAFVSLVVEASNELELNHVAYRLQDKIRVAQAQALGIQKSDLNLSDAVSEAKNLLSMFEADSEVDIDLRIIDRVRKLSAKISDSSVSADVRQKWDLLAKEISRQSANTFLIVDRAGSGKTSTLCNLALRYCRTRPTVFISGKVHLTDEFGLMRYIQDSLNYRADLSCQNAIQEIDTLISEHHKQERANYEPNIGPSYEMIIFVDGINESTNGDLMKRAILRTISTFRELRLLFCISCRDIFWSFFRDSLWNAHVFEMVQGGLYNFATNEFQTASALYLRWFNLECEFIGEAREKCRQPLLLRFFCETYGDPTGPVKSLGPILDIRLRQLFDEYWKRKISSVQLALSHRTQRSVEDFLYDIAAYMRTTCSRVMPLQSVIEATGVNDLESEKSLYVRTLDEDIILEQGFGKNLESVVTFVYDEFMEYTIAAEIANRVLITIRDTTIPQGVMALLSQSKDFPTLYGVGGYLAVMLADKGIFIWQTLLEASDSWHLPICNALERLGVDEFGEDSVEALRSLSESCSDAVVAQKIANIAYRLGQAGIFDLVMIWEHLFVRFGLVMARNQLVELARRGQIEAFQSLSKASLNKENDRSLLAAFGLIELPTRKPQWCYTLARDKDPLARLAATIGLRADLSERTEHLLIDLLKDTDSEVRLQACKSLARFNQVMVAQQLLTLRWKDPNGRVRREAQHSLARIAERMGNTEKHAILDGLERIIGSEELEKKSDADLFYWMGWNTAPWWDYSYEEGDTIYDLSYHYYPFTDSEWMDFDVVEIDAEGGPAESAVNESMKEIISHMLDTLTPREREIVEMRYGLDSFLGGVTTFEEVGQYFGVTGGRIQQIHGKALRKLRYSATKKQAEHYVNIESMSNPTSSNMITERERQLLRMLAAVRDQREMADRFSLSYKELHKQLVNLRRKLGVSDQSHTILEAIRLGLISSESLRESSREDTLANHLNYSPAVFDERESALLRLVTKGCYQDRMIAKELGYSVSTVKRIITVICKKLNVGNRYDAALFALKHDLL